MGGSFCIDYAVFLYALTFQTKRTPQRIQVQLELLRFLYLEAHLQYSQYTYPVVTRHIYVIVSRIEAILGDCLLRIRTMIFILMNLEATRTTWSYIQQCDALCY